MTAHVSIDAEQLRAEVRDKYREVALEPDAEHHFHTGRYLAALLGYSPGIVDALPDRAVESFAGVANPFHLRRIQEGETVVDVGSGAGFDSIVAAHYVGSTGRVIGVDMTPEMLAKSQTTINIMGLRNIEFRAGLAEALPIDAASADTVISNGVFNLCADKHVAFREVWRVLRPGGWVQFADIANGRPVPPEAQRQIDLWTG